MDPKYSYDYFIFGTKVTVHTEENRIRHYLGAFLGKCQDRQARHSSDAEISFDLYSSQFSPLMSSIPDSASLVSSPEFPVKIYKAGQEFYVTCGKSWLHLSIPQCHGIGVFDENIWKYPGFIESLFFSGLCVMFHCCGLYQVHSAGLIFQGKGFLFVGKSGSGKSTLALSLVKQGWKFLNDDIQFLCPLGSHVEALALPVEFKTEVRTLHKFFKNLKNDLAFKLPNHDGKPHYDKYYVRMDRLYQERFESHCLPRFLFFAEVGSNDTSDLVILEKNETLKRLLENSLLFMFDTNHAANHLAALNALVQQTTAYRLHAGRDVLENPEAFEKFLLDYTYRMEK